MNGLLFRGTELTLPEIKRMDRCSASLELRGQGTGCQIQQGKNKTKNPPSLCSEAVAALAHIYSISGVEEYIPGWAAGPTSCAVLWGAACLCSHLHCASRSMCSQTCCSLLSHTALVLVTFLWWIAEHWTCGIHLSSAPPVCPSPSLVKSLTLSSAFCTLQLCNGWSSLEATFDTNSQENLRDGPKEAPLHVYPFAALSPCFPGVRDSCLLQPSPAQLASPRSATLLRNLSGELDLADGGCYLIPQKCFVIEKMETVWGLGTE